MTKPRQTTKPKPPRSKAEQGASTRAKLIAVGRQLFAERGYAGVGTEEIVRTAKVTRGALYHHFADKRELFRAVYEDVERETIERTAAAAIGLTDPWEIAVTGSMAFLDECLDPAVQRITILDAPSVLGLAEWREIADQYGGALVQATLTALIEAGRIEEQPVKPLARMLTGALIEGGILIAEADDKKTARREVGEAVERLLRGLAI